MHNLLPAKILKNKVLAKFAKIKLIFYQTVKKFHKKKFQNIFLIISECAPKNLKAFKQEKSPMQSVVRIKDDFLTML